MLFFRLAQYVAHSYFVAAAVDELYDVVAVFGFHNARHFFGVGERKSYVGELWNELGLAAVRKLASLPAAAFVFGIHCGQRGEVAFARCYSLRIVAQVVFDVFYFLARNFRRLCYDLNFIACGNKRKAVLGHVLEETPHFGRGNFYLSRYFLFHLFNDKTVA